MEFIEIINTDMDVCYIRKSNIAWMDTYKGLVSIVLIDGTHFKAKFKRIKETDTILPIKNNNKCNYE